MQKKTLPAKTYRFIDGYVYAMVNSIADHGANGGEALAAVHNIVCKTKELGAAAAEYQTRCLREALGAKGIPVPECGDFIYWGGRCFPTPDLFKPGRTRRSLARTMARRIVKSIGTVRECSESEVTDALAASAALDEELLCLRTAELVKALAELRPDLAVAQSMGNFTILPDGSLLPLHFLYTA